MDNNLLEKIFRQNKTIIDQNKQILAALEKQKRWVRASVITSLTGWDKFGLQRARINGAIEWKKDKDGIIWYNPETIIK